MGRKATSVHKKHPYVNAAKNKEYKIDYLEKHLINLVKERPALYDPRVCEQEKTKEAKQILWIEISEGLEGKLCPSDVKLRWKYLRNCYIKAKAQHRVKEEIAQQSGTPVPPAGKCKDRKYSFRYYEIMQFLDDSLCYQKKMESSRFALNKELEKVPRAPNIINNVIPIAPQENLTDNDDSSIANSDKLNVTDYDKIFLECLQKPIAQPSPIDGFLIRLGEGLKKLPYRERSKLELEFLQRLYEVEEQLEN